MESHDNPLILLIDDDKELNLLRMQLFRKQGYRVVMTDNGKEGIELAKKHMPDLILLDVIMPGMSGPEVLKILKSNEETSGMFIVMISALRKSSGDVIHGLELGADGYITSPVPNELLLTQVATFLRQKFAMDKLRNSENEIRKVIAEKKVVEQKMIQDLERYNLAQRIGKVGNWEYNIDTAEFWGSEEAKRIYGLDVEDKYFTTEFIESCIPERERVHQALLDLIGKEKPYDIIFDIIPKNSSKTVTIHSKAQLVRDGKGNPIKILGVIQDVTQTREAENALKESEEKHRILLEHVGAGIGYYDLEGKLKHLNGVAAGIMGGKPDDFTGKTMTELYGPEPGEKYFRRIVGVSESDESVDFEDEVELQGKKYYFLSTYVRIKNNDGNVTGVQIVSKDITSRKLTESQLLDSEERFRFLSDVTFEAIVIHQNGIIRDVNKSFEKITGYTREEALGDNLYGSIVSEEDFEKVMANLRKDYASPYQIQARKKDGSIFWAEVEGRAAVHNDEEMRIVAIRDVTEKVQARFALEQSEEKYRMVVNNSLEGIFIIKQERFVYANPAIENLTGYTLAQIEGMSFLEFLYEDDRKMVADNHKRRLNGEVGAPYDIRILDKHKQPRWVRLNARKINWRGEDAVLCFIADIHDRKIAEETLAERERSLNDIVENSSNVFYTHDTNHQISYVSPQIETVLGYTPQEARMKWTDFASDNPVNDMGLNYTMKAIETGEPQPPYELELVHKSGRKVWVEVWEAPIVTDGKVVGLTGSLTDITGRKTAEQALVLSEKKFRTYVEESPTAIFIASSRGQYVFVNPAACNLLQYSSEELLNMSIRDVVPAKKVKQSRENFDKIKQIGRSKRTETTMKRKDGVEIDVLLEAVKLSEDEVMAYCRDITYLKNIERDLQKANEEYQVLNEELEKGNIELQNINTELE